MPERMGAGVAEENVLIRAGACSLTLMPPFGGKIASLRFRGHELLQAPLAPITERTRTMPFEDSDASGWDECLPSVAPCRVETPAGMAAIPDHGDLWRVAWVESGEQGTGNRERASGIVSLLGECFSLPLTLSRTVALTGSEDGAQLRLDYTLTNTGSYAVPWSWAAHPLFAAEAGDRILLPGSIGVLRVEGSGSGRLAGQAAWPLATLSNGMLADLSRVEPPESGIGDKLFAGPLTFDENWCALERPTAGVRITVRFDSAATPYLGIWICHGGWPSRPGPKQTCVALEPATAPVDSLARTGEWSRTLAPGERRGWHMQVDLESM